jgi:NADH-quinone oxidoreductase subunit J
MQGALGSAISAASSILAAGPYTTPAAVRGSVVILLCILAAFGTILLLPSRMDIALRRLGGTFLLAAILCLGALGISHEANHMGVYFWIFALIALAGAVRVISHPQPVYAALYFVLTVFATAGLFILMQAEFMAAALVIIYAGAILITYVFVIMLASQAHTPGSTPSGSDYDATSRDRVIASAVGFVLMGTLIYVIFDKADHMPGPGSQTVLVAETYAGAPVQGQTQQLGQYLFAAQSVNLELAGLILTLSMVGAIVIARRRVISTEPVTHRPPEMETAPMTPADDSPHSIPVYGTDNPRQKAYPET